jgi:murein DD-endopeptidase MepM/ murein hydrolase activator NlpD
MRLAKPFYLKDKHVRSHDHLKKLSALLFVALVIAVNYIVFIQEDNLASPAFEEKFKNNQPSEHPSLPIKNLELDKVQPKIAEITVHNGESLLTALNREGFDSGSLMPAVNKLGEMVDFKGIKSGQKITVSTNPDGTLISLKYPVSEILYYEVIRDGDNFKAVKKEEPVNIEIARLGCMIRSSLYESIQRCGEDGSLVNIISELLAWDINLFSDVRKGDQLRIIVEKIFLKNKFISYGRILAIEYSGRIGKYLIANYTDSDGSEQYYNANGSSLIKKYLKTPLRFSRVSSDYSYNRFHPILHVTKEHLGIDYSAPKGTPVWSVGKGKIVFKGFKGVNGNTIVIDHEDGYKTYYAHLSKFNKEIREGDLIDQKQIIGFIGSTGRSTGPHVHFAVSLDSKFVHPAKLKNAGVEQIPPEQKDAFLKKIEEIKKELRSIPLNGISRKGV